MRRICSKDDFYSNRVSDLKTWLGYEEEIVESQVNRAALLDRNSILEGNSRGGVRSKGREIFSAVFHPALRKKVYSIFREAHVILECDEEHKKLFPSILIVSFRHAKTLQDILVRSKLTSGDQEGTCQGCQKSNCQVCNYIVNSGSFENSDKSRTFTIRRGKYNYNFMCYL